MLAGPSGRPVRIHTHEPDGWRQPSRWSHQLKLPPHTPLRVRVKIMGLIIIRSDRDFPTILCLCDPVISPRARVQGGRRTPSSVLHS
jgi:hypothetical protein